MRRTHFSFLAIIVIIGWLTAARADDVGSGDAGYVSSVLEDSKSLASGGDDLECDAGCRGGGIVFQAEALMFKYHRADGVRAGSYNNVPPAFTDDVEFDNAITPRLTLGYVGAGGLGARVRWWEYDQVGKAVFPDTGVAMGVDTTVVDLEVFETVQLTDVWSVELSGGVRYNHYDEQAHDPIPLGDRNNSFDGWGGVVGLEGRRTIGRIGGLYARGRGAIMMDDKTVTNVGSGFPQQVILNDVTQGMTELAIGWEYTRPMGAGLLRLRTGYEWQNWFNYGTSFTPITTAPANSPPTLAGPCDIGFSGFTVMVGFER